MAQYTDPYAFSRGWDSQQEQFDRRNAFAANQRQQQIENTRADAEMQMRRTQFDQGQAERAAVAKQQSIGRVGVIAQKALAIADPAQRKGFLQTAIPAYAQDFTAIGSDPSKLPEMLAMPDADLERTLQHVAQLAPEAKPIEVAKGGAIVTRDPSGGYREVYSNPDTAETGKGDFTLSPGEVRFDRSGKRIAEGGPKTLSKPEGFDIAAKLRGEYNAQAKEFTGVADSYQRIRDSAADPSAAGDLALIFNYMKVLDPGSTVREGEFATAQNAGGIDSRVVALYNRVMSGERLAPGQRDDFVNRATKLYKGQEARFNTRVRARYEGLARRYGLEPAEVLSDPTAATSMSSAEPVRVNTPDEAMALAPGTQFVTPDGRVKVRP